MDPKISDAEFLEQLHQKLQERLEQLREADSGDTHISWDRKPKTFDEWIEVVQRL